MSGVTPSQTAGPFFSDCLLRDDARVIAPPEVGGTHVRLEGTVRDGAGEPVEDALIEVWQADANGRYRHPADAGLDSGARGFVGWGRTGTEHGSFWFETIKPGCVPWGTEEFQAPHLVMNVFARGLLDLLTTRMYFEDEPGNDRDPLLQSLPPNRRATLLARRVSADLYRFDIVLQGEDETVFFDVGARRRGR